MFLTFMNFIIFFNFGLLFLTMGLYWFQATYLLPKNLHQSPFVVVFISGFLQTLYLVLRWYESNHFPLSNLYESLLFLSCLLTYGLIFLNTQTIGFQFGNIKSWSLIFNNYYKNLNAHEVILNSVNGCIITPPIVLINTFALLYLPKELQTSTALVPALQSNWLQMHVTVMIASYAVLMLGCLFAMGYLLTIYFIQSKLLSKYAIVHYIECLEDQIKHQDNKYSPSFLQRWFDVSFLLAFEFKDFDLPGETINTNKSVTTDSLRLNHKHKETNIAFNQISNEYLVNANTSYGDLNNTASSNNQAVSGIDLLSNNIFSSNASSINSDSSKSTSGNTPSFKMEHENKLLTQFALFSYLSGLFDNWSYRLIGLGFPLLTIGLLSGAVWANQTWGSYWSWDPKETWALITWFVFAIYLHTRVSKGWKGSSSAYLATFGFFIIWVCYLGVNLLGNGLHSYGFFN